MHTYVCMLLIDSKHRHITDINDFKFEWGSHKLLEVHFLKSILILQNENINKKVAINLCIIIISKSPLALHKK